MALAEESQRREREEFFANLTPAGPAVPAANSGRLRFVGSSASDEDWFRERPATACGAAYQLGRLLNATWRLERCAFLARIRSEGKVTAVRDPFLEWPAHRRKLDQVFESLPETATDPALRFHLRQLEGCWEPFYADGDDAYDDLTSKDDWLRDLLEGKRLGQRQDVTFPHLSPCLWIHEIFRRTLGTCGSESLDAYDVGLRVDQQVRGAVEIPDFVGPIQYARSVTIDAGPEGILLDGVVAVDDRLRRHFNGREPAPRGPETVRSAAAGSGRPYLGLWIDGRTLTNGVLRETLSDVHLHIFSKVHARGKAGTTVKDIRDGYPGGDTGLYAAKNALNRILASFEVEIAPRAWRLQRRVGGD